MKIFKYVAIIPVLILLMSCFSFTEQDTEETNANDLNIDQKADLVIGEITWKGNTLYSSSILNEVLGVKSGDIFSKETIHDALSYQPNKKDVASMYMDNGYLFFRVDMKEQKVGDKVDLTFDIYEGNQVSVNNITICCTQKVETSKVLGIIGIQKGELFSRAKILQSQKALKESGLFKTDGMILTPIPDDKGRLVDLEYKLEEI